MKAVEILGKIYINKYAFGCVLRHFPSFMQGFNAKITFVYVCF